MTAGIEFFKAGLRVWRRSAGVSFLAAAAIAVATALLLSMTSVIWGVFEADLPGVEARGLYRVHLSDPEADVLSLPVSPAEYLAWTREPGLLDAAGAFVGASFTLTGDGRPAQRLNGAYVTPSLLAMTGARPLLGDLFAGETQEVATARAQGDDGPRALFFQVESLDLRHFTAVDLTFALVAGLALFIPARRATRISPVELLKRE